MTNAQHISPDDLALYALSSLSQDESAALRDHLSECDQCRTELAGIRGDLALLALSVDQHPLPGGARERFTRRIASHQPTNKPSEPAPIDRLSRDRAGRPGGTWRGWISAGWIAAAALFIVTAGLTYQVILFRAHLRDSLSRIASLEASKSRAEQVAEVLTAPAAQRVLLTPPNEPPAPTGRVVYLPSRGALILEASHLKPVPIGKTYALWVIPADGSAPIPAGLFRPDAAGNGSVVLPPIPHGVAAKAFGVTVENAAGSKTPTAPILLAGAVAAHGASAD